MFFQKLLLEIKTPALLQHCNYFSAEIVFKNSKTSFWCFMKNGLFLRKKELYQKHVSNPLHQTELGNFQQLWKRVGGFQFKPNFQRKGIHSFTNFSKLGTISQSSHWLPTQSAILFRLYIAMLYEVVLFTLPLLHCSSRLHQHYKLDL